MIVSFHEVYAHQISLTLPLFIEVSVPSQKHMSGHAKGITFAQSYDLHWILYMFKECGIIVVLLFYYIVYYADLHDTENT
jgi:hypothetical protein